MALLSVWRAKNAECWDKTTAAVLWLHSDLGETRERQEWLRMPPFPHFSVGKAEIEYLSSMTLFIYSSLVHLYFPVTFN